jgi:hypothetical protein
MTFRDLETDSGDNFGCSLSWGPYTKAVPERGRLGLSKHTDRASKEQNFPSFLSDTKL